MNADGRRLVTLLIAISMLTFINFSSEASPSEPEWVITTVDESPTFGYNSITIDSYGNPHIIYIDDGTTLKYAYYNGDDWELSAVGPADDNTKVSLAIHDDVLHVAFVKGDSQWYGWLDDGVWNLTDIGSSDVRGSSIAMDSDGKPHISFSHFNDPKEVKYASYEEGSWSIEAVYSTNSYSTDIAIDADGNPHIVHRSDRESVVHTRYDSSGWISDVVDTSDHSNYLHPSYESIDIDDSGRVIIAYLNASGELGTDLYLKMAKSENGAWNTSTIDSETIQRTPLTVVASNGIHVFYTRAATDYTYAHNDGESWEIIEVMHRGTTGTASGSLAMDQGGWPHVAMSYRTTEGSELRHGVYGDYYAPVFTSSPSDGQAGRYYQYTPEFNEEEVVITDYSTDADFLQWNGESYQGTPGPFDHGWYSIYIEALSVQGRLKSTQNENFFIDTRWSKSEPGLLPVNGSNIQQRGGMDLDAQDRPHVTYHDNDGNLVYSYWDGQSWIGHIRNDSGNVRNNVITIGDNGDIHLLYRVGSTAVYEYHDGAWNTPETVSTGVSSLIHLDILFDGTPVAAFANGIDVAYSVREGDGSWSIELIETGTNSAVESFTVDGDGAPHLTTVFSDGTGWQMRHHTKNLDDGAWVTSTVQDRPSNGENSIGNDAGIDTDSEGRVHVAYREGQSILWYSVLDEGGWTHEIVHDTHNVRDFSLVVDDDDVPHFNYYNAFSSRLMYNVWNGTGWDEEIVDGARIVEGTSNLAGRDSTLRLDSSGTPHTLYLEATDWEYRYASMDKFAPDILNQPTDCYVGDQYEYRPIFDEKANIDVATTDTDFLTWDGEKFFGIPSESDAGTWWINITATAVYGGLSSQYNMSFTILGYHAPALSVTDADQVAQVGESYFYRIEANESVQWDVSTGAPFLLIVKDSDRLTLSATPSESQIGTYAVNITATSDLGLLSSYENFTLTVMPRWSPDFISDPVLNGTEGRSYNYKVIVNESVTWNPLSTNATFLNFNEGNQTIYGQLPLRPGNSFYVNISAVSVDGKEAGYQNYTLNIRDGWPPEITSPSDAIQLQVTFTADYQATANESVFWSKDTDASFITLDPDGIFLIEPTKGQEGTYYLNITATSVNDFRTSHLNLSITVTGVWAPDWSQSGEWTVEETFEFHNVLQANETVVWEYDDDLPSSITVTIDGNVFTLSGTPYIGDAGSYFINVTSTSVEGTQKKNINYSFVIQSTPLPEITSEPPDSVAMGHHYSYAPTFINVSDDHFDFWTNAEFLHWDEVGAHLSGDPGPQDIGTWSVNISVTLDNNQSTYQNYTLSVYGWAPEIGPTPIDARQGSEYSHMFQANESVVWYYHANMPGEWAVIHEDRNLTLTGMPDGPAGDYYFNISATSMDGGMKVTNNYTLTIIGSWSPTLMNVPQKALANLSYVFTPQYNETVTIVLAETNAPFLVWNEEEERFEGTPSRDHTGSYWIKLNAVSQNGMLADDSNMTFSVVLEEDDVEATAVCVTPFAILFLMFGAVAASRRLL